MKYIFILSIMLLFSSCMKKIDINPSNGKQAVIIQGYLYNDSTAKVIVAKSTNYLSTTKPPRITDAVVTLSDNHGNSEVLVWNPALGRYESSTMVGVVSDIYTLTVTMEGQTYSSTSVLPVLYEADSIEVPFVPANGFQKEGYFMKLYATIPTDQDLYFLFKGYSTDSLMNDANTIVYADNTMISGKLEGIDMGYEYKPGDLAKLYLYSLTKDAYRFYDAASIQLTSDGGFFSTPPANVPSMFNNGAIGLFQCSQLQLLTKTVVAQ